VPTADAGPGPDDDSRGAPTGAPATGAPATGAPHVGASLADVAPVLSGRRVRLEPLCADHVPDLAAAADEDRRTYGYTTVPGGAVDTAEYVRARLSPDFMPFAHVRTSDGRAVGSTSFLTFRHRPDDGRLFAVEIGGTWLAASAQATGINREAKLLMLTHAFEVWQVGRVDLKTDARNDRSRRSIEGIGARFEGVLRNWQPSLVEGEEGGLRDTAMFSIVAAEWPSVGECLRRDLGFGVVGPG
jgi:RimJ/RimL family protein N-acetyltransferase